VLIGRDDERDALVAGVKSAVAGRGSLELLLGEAGVGKSRLVGEVRAVADQDGLRTVVGRAVDAETPVPFRPFSEGLLAAFRADGPPQVRELLPMRAALGRLVPEWREPDVTDAEPSLVVVGEAVLRLLRVIAGGRACLLVLEDLQWADPETLAVVEYLADNLATERVMCLATIRSEEATPALSLARSLDARRAARVTSLKRLDQADTERMAEACLGAGSVPANLTKSLSAWSEGVPFLVEEHLAAWMQSGALVWEPEQAAWALRSDVGPVVPATFAETIHRRMAGLGPDGQAVLSAAAVLGRRFDWPLVAAIAQLDESAVMACLRRCVDAQLVTVNRHVIPWRCRHGIPSPGVRCLVDRVSLLSRARVQ